MIARIPWVPFSPTLKGKLSEIIIIIIIIIIISSSNTVIICSKNSNEFSASLNDEKCF